MSWKVRLRSFPRRQGKGKGKEWKIEKKRGESGVKVCVLGTPERKKTNGGRSKVQNFPMSQLLSGKARRSAQAN